MNLRLLLVVSALTLAGVCEPPPNAVVELSALPDERGPIDSLSRRFSRLRERVVTRGYDELAGLSRVFLLEERGRALPLDLKVGRCTTLLALGGGRVRELELSLYDGEGAVAVVDSVRGEGGLLHVCPPDEGGARTLPYHLVIRAAEGAGAVMIAHYLSPLGQGEGFDELFSGILAPTVPFREVEELLNATRRAQRGRGLSLHGEPLLERVAEGAVVRSSVELAEAECYVALARAGEGVLDVDLFLYDPAGVEVARDLGSDAEPSIEHCPAQRGRFTLELRAFEGAGAVGLMVLRSSGRGSDEPMLQSPNATDEAPDASLQVEVYASALRERMFSPPLYVSRDAALVPGELRTHEVVIGPGCAVMVGAASHEGMDLDLYLADGNGNEIDRDTAVHPMARVRACSATPEVMRVGVKGYGRDGHYALAVVRAPPTVRTLAALRLEEASAAFEARGYRSVGDRSVLISGDGLSSALPLEAGHCVAVVLTSDEGRPLTLSLLSAEGAPIASDNQVTSVVSRCAEEAEMGLRISVQGADGPVRARLRLLAFSNDDDSEDGAVETPTPPPHTDVR